MKTKLPLVSNALRRPVRRQRQPWWPAIDIFAQLSSFHTAPTCIGPRYGPKATWHRDESTPFALIAALGISKSPSKSPGSACQGRVAPQRRLRSPTQSGAPSSCDVLFLSSKVLPQRLHLQLGTQAEAVGGILLAISTTAAPAILKATDVEPLLHRGHLLHLGGCLSSARSATLGRGTIQLSSSSAMSTCVSGARNCFKGHEVRLKSLKRTWTEHPDVRPVASSSISFRPLLKSRSQRTSQGPRLDDPQLRGIRRLRTAPNACCGPQKRRLHPEEASHTALLTKTPPTSLPRPGPAPLLRPRG